MKKIILGGAGREQIERIIKESGTKETILIVDGDDAAINKANLLSALENEVDKFENPITIEPYPLGNIEYMPTPSRKPKGKRNTDFKQRLKQNLKRKK